MKGFKDKRVLVTGVCGSIGSELVRQLLDEEINSPAEVIGIDNNESELFFQDQRYLSYSKARFFVVDIRDRDALIEKSKGVDVIFHSAALKHVVLCERSPSEALKTNIIGVENVIEAATRNNVETVIFTSSDKAVNPTNVMGTSKLMGERLMTAANSLKRGKGPIFASTRFGNVLGSNGSVVPIFHNQIASGGPVTLTDREMTRFIMSIEEAVRLVLDSAAKARGGEVFITKMPVVRIEDIATAMIEELAESYGKSSNDIEIIEIGVKPGEKLYEELMSDEETRRAVELKNYFSVLPAFRGMYREIDYGYEDLVNMAVSNPYISEKEAPLTVEEIRAVLRDYKLLDVAPGGTVTRYWPGDKEGGK